MVARTLLTPLSWLYAGGWQCYRAVYQFGFKHAAEPHCPILVVGNLSVGGSGKSPFTLFLAHEIRQLGYSVVVSASGYGAPRAEAATTAPPGPLPASEWGDEPAMMRWLMPDLPLIVGRRRVLAAEIAHREFPDAILLMDDGFQHLPLKKQISIVLDEPHPVNPRCLPAGPYREPRSNAKFADLVVPGEFRTVRNRLTLEDPLHGTTQTPAQFNVLCALGRPERFLADLDEDFPGAHHQAVLRPDHDRLMEGNLWSALGSELPIVVTAKDWVKLRERPDLESARWWVARSSVSVTPPASFRTWLKAKLDDAILNGITQDRASQ